MGDLIQLPGLSHIRQFGGVLKDLVTGLVCLLVACMLLWINEGYALEVERSLLEARQILEASLARTNTDEFSRVAHPDEFDAESPATLREIREEAARHRIHDFQTAFETVLAERRRRIAVRTWLLRVTGLILMFLGSFVITGPLAGTLKEIPGFAEMVQMGNGKFAALVAVTLSLLIIGLRWMWHHVFLTLTVLGLLAAGLVWWFWPRKVTR